MNTDAYSPVHGCAFTATAADVGATSPTPVHGLHVGSVGLRREQPPRHHATHKKGAGPSPQQLAILAQVAKEPRSTPAAVAAALGRNRVTVRRLLSKLHARGAVVRGAGWYALPAQVDNAELTPLPRRPTSRNAVHLTSTSLDTPDSTPTDPTKADSSGNRSQEGLKAALSATLPVGALRYRVVATGDVYAEPADCYYSAAQVINARHGIRAWSAIAWERIDEGPQ